MSIKKNYVELWTYLNKNKDKKVSELLSDIEIIVTSKKNNITIAYDDKGKAYAIFCYYHKQWELLSDVEYGKKASSKSGFNTMCKVGTNLWTKQQSTAKNAKAKLLSDVATSKVKPSDLPIRLNEIEDARNAISSKDMPKGTKKMPNPPIAKKEEAKK